MNKVKRFRDFEDEELFEEFVDGDVDFERNVKDAEKRRKQDRKNKRKEKRSYLDEEDY